MDDDQDINMQEPIDLTIFIDMSGPAQLEAGIERMTRLRQFFPADAWVEVQLIPAICERDW